MHQGQYCISGVLDFAMQDSFITCEKISTVPTNKQYKQKAEGMLRVIKRALSKHMKKGGENDN